MARALDVPFCNPLEARVSYVSSCTNSLEDRLSHVSYVNLLDARVSHASCINLLWAGLSYVSYLNLLIATVLYISFVNPLEASESSVSRIIYHDINLLVVTESHVGL